MMKCWGLTDKGCIRRENQDSFAFRQLDRNTLLCVVCDGMGGARAGNVASSLAVDVFLQEFGAGWHAGLEWDRADQLLRLAVRQANTAVFEESSQIEEFNGMGTTLVAALIRNRSVSVINVGDSRAYAIKRSSIRQITRDHSLVQLMVDRGSLSPEMAKHYPGKNLITRAVGTDPTVTGDIYRLEMDRGNFLLLCTDGLSNMMDDQEILFEVIHGIRKDRCCQRLQDIVISRGSPDNVTSVLVSL